MSINRGLIEQSMVQSHDGILCSYKMELGLFRYMGWSLGYIISKKARVKNKSRGLPFI